MIAQAAREGSRLPSLDGLRGLASVVVVLHHALLTVPAFARVYFSAALGQIGPITTIAAYTPLHLLWEGGTAVYVFFILSGVVLTRSVKTPNMSYWISYYPRRLLRLYGPIWAAVALGGLTILAIPRFHSQGLGPWINARPLSYDAHGLLLDVSLVFGNSDVISPLWTLRWEILFSILLPVYITLARIRMRFHLEVWLLILLLAVAAVLDMEAVVYLCTFGLGVLISSNWDWLSAYLRPRSDALRLWIPIIVSSVLLGSTRWLLLAAGVDANVARAFRWVAIAGALGFVVSACFWDGARRTLSTRGVLWLGAISFSLYLVHEPIVIGVRLLMQSASPWLALCVSVPVAFSVAWLFYKFIESPIHRLSRTIGQWATRSLGSRTQETKGSNHRSPR
ncbi:acyltransferase [Rathayibacter sp. YIM 133350]|uniref:acyltransferase family protein n=1 Tax=Rathayibacter sp. YIM 133350 TaxID=3131992 RepID=UPI00307E2D5D